MSEESTGFPSFMISLEEISIRRLSSFWFLLLFVPLFKFANGRREFDPTCLWQIGHCHCDEEAHTGKNSSRSPRRLLGLSNTQIKIYKLCMSTNRFKAQTSRKKTYTQMYVSIKQFNIWTGLFYKLDSFQKILRFYQRQLVLNTINLSLSYNSVQGKNM